MVQTISDSLSRHIDRLRPLIDDALDDFTKLSSGCPRELREAIRYSLLSPGKRLRPFLVLMAAEACDAGTSGGAAQTAIPAAAAVEMVHAYSLIHDDLPAMDDDDLRRGRPTCHKKFGEATAILAGDALLALAFETLTRLECRPEVVARCCATLAEASGPCQLVGGQAADMAGGLVLCNTQNDGSGATAGLSSSAENTVGQANRGTRAAADDDSAPGEILENNERQEQLESIHRRKTGALILASLRLGSLVAGADRVAGEALEQYGRRLGLAFQITDDLLDARGDEAAMGKRVGKDAGLGKLTFPGLMGIDKSRRLAEQLIGEARDSLVPLLGPTEGLRLLAQYVLERDS